MQRAFEHVHVLMRDREVNVRLAIAGSIECSFYEMVLHRRAWSLWIVMEEQHSLGQLAVVKTLLEEHILNDFLILSVLYKILNALALILSTSGI